MENLQTLKLEYEDYLRNQRGLSEKSVYDCWRFADRFLNFRFKGRRPDLAKITPADIARFMQHLISRGKPFRDKTPPARGNCMTACRFRRTLVKRLPVTSGRIVSRHPARCSYGIACRTWRLLTLRS